MQKLNLKYFVGSFLLSLVAVFIATKAYLIMSWENTAEETISVTTETKNIELFAANEENDPIYEKYKQLSAAEAPLGTEATLAAEPLTIGAAVSDKTEVSEQILYAENSAEETTEISAASSTNTDEDILSTAFADDGEWKTADIMTDKEDSEELQIVDASAAPNFAIPLKHNFKIETGVVTVSDEADAGHIALASKNVSIYNLGTENAAAITEPLETDEEDTVLSETSSTGNTDDEKDYTQNVDDDPWDVAETANKHATKNTFGAKSAPLQHDVTLPDEEVSTNQTVAYKLQPNILIPIPEDILNDENLTPQFSTSKENLMLEQELRNKHQLPELKPEERIDNKTTAPTYAPNGDGTIPSIDDEKDFDSDGNTSEEDAEEEETSRSLSQNVALWFDGIKTKATGKSTETAAKKESKGKSGSIFQRLLGKDADQEIVPTELKLSFQPNRAEISGQTLEWLHAFADNAVNNDDVIVEIRVDRSASFELQQKRLKLLYKVLADNGVEQRKVNILFTDREPNSFIIRNVRYASEEERIAVTKKSDNPWN